MGKKILIVDDEPDVRLLIKSILEISSYDVVEASNGEDALDVMRKEDVGLVLLDVMMPRMDGLHTAHEIRKFSQVPIVMVSVKDDDVTINMAKKLYNVSDYIRKPFDNEQFLEVVKKYFKE